MELSVSEFKPNFLQKLANTMAAFIALPMALSIVAACFADMSTLEKLFAFLNLKNEVIDHSWVVILSFILIYSIVWHIQDMRRRDKQVPFPNETVWNLGIRLSRYLFAFVLFSYGFAKLLGAQFPVPYLLFGTELGDLNGSQLTVAFFSYSPLYGNTIGVIQIIGSVAILFQRTARLAFFILLPIVANIFFIDFTFDGWEGPRPIISMLCYILLFNLALDFHEIKDFFFSRKTIPATKPLHSILAREKTRLVLKIGLICLLLFFSSYDIYRFKEVFQNQPGYSSVLDGAWESKKVETYNASLRQFDTDQRNSQMFVGEQVAILKRSGDSIWYNLNFDIPNKGNIEMAAQDDSLNLKHIKARYNLINKDSLEISGTEGKDSIRWVFKRTK